MTRNLASLNASTFSRLASGLMNLLNHRFTCNLWVTQAHTYFKYAPPGTVHLTWYGHVLTCHLWYPNRSPDNSWCWCWCKRQVMKLHKHTWWTGFGGDYAIWSPIACTVTTVKSVGGQNWNCAKEWYHDDEWRLWKHVARKLELSIL